MNSIQIAIILVTMLVIFKSIPNCYSGDNFQIQLQHRGRCPKIGDIDLPPCLPGYYSKRSKMSQQIRAIPKADNKYGYNSCFMQQTCCTRTISEEINSLYEYYFNGTIFDYFYDGNYSMLDYFYDGNL